MNCRNTSEAVSMIADISVVIPTVGRSSLMRAVASIFKQDFAGNIQILIGLDRDVYGHAGDIKALLLATCPPNRFLTWIDPGYSTSRRHGGVHSCHFGGSLRVALSFLAQSRYVMYLDDDDWIAENHCSDMMKAIQDKKWAYARCFYADGNLGVPICEDQIESVGVNGGIYSAEFGGFVRPSGLMLDKLAMPYILHLWAESPYPAGDGEDRSMFHQLKHLAHGFSGRASVYYAMDPKDRMHAVRLAYIQQQGKSFGVAVKNDSIR